MTDCASCGFEIPDGAAHHFDADGNVWHEECEAPEVLVCGVEDPEICESCT